MNRPWFIIAALALVALGIYLFVQAPPPLADEEVIAGDTVSIETVMRLIAAENDVARTIWTREIVGKGKEMGLAFGEDWQEEGVDKGPLPALFLRLSASSLERNPVPLSLFLGSDYPLSPSNLFTGKQAETFEVMKASGEPQFFYSEDTQVYTAMFPDMASVQPCVTCHNEPPDTPKADWVLDDMMGATTWAYPKGEVTMDEFVEIIQAVRGGFGDAYNNYLEKAATFADPPEVGEQWPGDGVYAVPSAEVFLTEFSKQASARSVEILLNAREQTEQEEADLQLESLMQIVASTP